MSNLLAAKIKQARLSANLTQAQLAEKLNLSRGAVTQWESMTDETRSTPTLKALQRLAQIVDVPLEWLMDEAHTFKSLEEARQLLAHWNKSRSGGIANLLRSRYTSNHLGLSTERDSASPEEQQTTTFAQNRGSGDLDGTGIENRPRHAPEFSRRYQVSEEKETPHRMSRAFWKSVEFTVLSARPDLEDAFDAPIRCPGTKLHADFYTEDVVVEFKAFPINRYRGPWFMTVVGQLLMTEALAGRTLKKQLLIWVPDNDTIQSAQRRLKGILEALERNLPASTDDFFRKASVEMQLEEYAEIAGVAGAHKLLQLQETAAAMKIEVLAFHHPAEAAKHLLSLV
jgi:transcriptional regulator with XRE-family HTH domain